MTTISNTHFTCLLLLAGSVSTCGPSDARLAQLEARVSRLESRAIASPASAAPTSSPALEADAGQPPTNDYPGERRVGDWLLTGVGAPDFDLRKDGEGITIDRIADGSRRWVAVVRAVSAEPYIGKTVAATLDVQTNGMTEGGACLIKVQRQRQLVYWGFLAADLKELPATTDNFVPCEVVAQIPPTAKWVLYGFTYHGPGRVSVRSASIAAK